MEKQFGLIVSLIGAGLVLFLVFLGINLKEMSERGPGWLRRVLVAGLALLGLFGFSPDAASAADWIQNPYAQNAASGPALEATDTGKELMEIWARAEEAASGKRGPYPFDSKGQTQMLADLEHAAGLIDELVKSKVFQAPEGDLLKIDLKQLVRGVQGMRPTEMQGATCYSPMMPTQIKESFERLSSRLPYLEKLGLEKLSPLAIRTVLDKMEQDLKVLATRNPTENFDKVDETKARELEVSVGKLIGKIREGLGKSPGQK